MAKRRVELHRRDFAIGWLALGPKVFSRHHSNGFSLIEITHHKVIRTSETHRRTARPFISHITYNALLRPVDQSLHRRDCLVGRHPHSSSDLVDSHTWPRRLFRSHPSLGLCWPFMLLPCQALRGIRSRLSGV